jgi:glycosyltransferase involved in cell wall biosynthesis
MRIIYDGFIYSAQNAGGINRYFSNIIERLPDNFTPTLTVPALNKLNFPTHKNLKLIKFKRFKPARLSSILEKIYYYEVLKFGGTFNLQHPTYYEMLTPNKYNPVKSPTIRTVYDMIHELYPPTMDPTGYQLTLKKNTITSADFIICISENTKKDLMELYAVPEEKIQVIYIATDFHINMSYGTEPVPDRPYFLYVGSRAIGYKNFFGLLEALGKVIKTNPDVCLAVVGAKFNENELSYIHEHKLSGNIINYGNIPDNHLAKLYRQSLAFVYPSLYEGFGIPPLEAMACGGLVIASNRASIPEVTGDAAILFDPGVKDELACILEQVVKGFNRREEFLTRGLERANFFSWDKTASQTIELYRKLSK